MDSIARPPEATPPSERSLGELIREMNQHGATLVKKEFELARAEAGETLHHVRDCSVWVVAAAVPAACAVVCVGIGATYAFALVMPIWAAAAVSTLVFAGLASVFAAVAYRRIKAFGPPLSRTVRSLKENAAWMEEKVS